MRISFKIFFPTFFTTNTSDEINKFSFTDMSITDDVHTAIKNTIKEKNINDDDHRIILNSNGYIAYMSYDDMTNLQNNPNYIEVDVWKEET